MKMRVRDLISVASIVVFSTFFIPSAHAQDSITVGPGDSLHRISERYGVSVSAILGANPSIVDPNMIRLGETILIPGAAPVRAWEAATSQPVNLRSSAVSASSGSVLADTLLVTWYGNPRTGLMGVLGQFDGPELASRLQRQADAYAQFTNKRVLPAYQLIAVVALGSPGGDGLWRRRETRDVIDAMLQEARTYGFPLILDVQVGHSTVEDELEHLRPYLEQPDVYLAIDPEFDMWPGQTPGEQIGHTTAKEVNYALSFLEDIIRTKELPPKVLILHQFTLNMLPDKENIGRSPVVDLVLDMDGFGAQWLKLDSYRMVMAQPLEFAAVKLFYDQDPGLFTPEEVMTLDPLPSVVIYQ